MVRDLQGRIGEGLRAKRDSVLAGAIEFHRSLDTIELISLD